MQIHTECFNPYHTNCYFLTDEETGSTAVIDPGCYFRCERTRVQRLVRTNGWHIERLLATHLHIDHVFGASFMTDTYGCPLEASPLDNYWADLAPERCKEVGLELRRPVNAVTHPLQHGDTVCFGKETLSVLSVPGHSPGCLAYYHPASKSLFSGDTLFKNGIGRTDLPGGDRELLVRSIREIIFRLPDDTIVYPGHDAPTLVGDEKRNAEFSGLAAAISAP